MAGVDAKHPALAGRRRCATWRRAPEPAAHLSVLPAPIIDDIAAGHLPRPTPPDRIMQHRRCDDRCGQSAAKTTQRNSCDDCRRPARASAPLVIPARRGDRAVCSTAAAAVARRSSRGQSGHAEFVRRVQQLRRRAAGGRPVAGRSALRSGRSRRGKHSSLMENDLSRRADDTAPAASSTVDQPLIVHRLPGERHPGAAAISCCRPRPSPKPARS